MSEETTVQVEKTQALDLNDQMIIRREKLDKYREAGVYPFGQRFVVKEKAATIKENFRDYDGQPVVIAGRIMTIRSHG